MLRYTLLFIYVIVNILLFIINWSLFTTTVEFNLGFAVFETLPFLILQIFGGLMIVVLTTIYSTRNLLKEIAISELQKRNAFLRKKTELTHL